MRPVRPARYINPTGAPIVIASAWTASAVDRSGQSEAERAFDRGHAVTMQPEVLLRNASRRAVVAIKLRFKADDASHAVTIVHARLAPGAEYLYARTMTMWGDPADMRVQVLGVQFADGGTWGSLDAAIDAGQEWIATP